MLAVSSKLPATTLSDSAIVVVRPARQKLKSRLPSLGRGAADAVRQIQRIPEVVKAAKLAFKVLFMAPPSYVKVRCLFLR